jgi:hypothetical protein
MLQEWAKFQARQLSMDWSLKLGPPPLRAFEYQCNSGVGSMIVVSKGEANGAFCGELSIAKG